MARQALLQHASKDTLFRRHPPRVHCQLFNSLQAAQAPTWSGPALVRRHRRCGACSCWQACPPWREPCSRPPPCCPAHRRRGWGRAAGRPWLTWHARHPHPPPLPPPLNRTPRNRHLHPHHQAARHVSVAGWLAKVAGAAGAPASAHCAVAKPDAVRDLPDCPRCASPAPMRRVLSNSPWHSVCTTRQPSLHQRGMHQGSAQGQTRTTNSSSPASPSSSLITMTSSSSSSPGS